jgi:release factor glutamine methyltransferase
MLERAREFLARKGLEESRLDAELLVADALGLDRLHLFLQLDRPIVEVDVIRARDLLVRRAAHEPVAYLTGLREFYGRPFAVDPRVLIPRPETELLVDLARERAKALDHPPRVADIGTGSGCIAVTLALELPGSEVVAVDSSAAALEVAQANATSLAADVRFVQADGTEALEGSFDLLLSNPPYIAPETADSLAPEVRDHEPLEALFAPPGDPDHWVRRLVCAAPKLLADGGALLIELGHDQAERARAFAGEQGLAATLHEDLARIPRVLECSAPAP